MNEWRKKAIELEEDDNGPLCQCGHWLYLHTGEGEVDSSCCAGQCECLEFVLS